MTCPQSRSHVFSDALPFRCNTEADTCHPSPGCYWLWTDFAQFGEDSVLFLMNPTTGSQQRDIWVEGQSWCWGQVCFLRMSMTPSHSLALVCLLEPGSWLLKGKSHQEASSAFPVQVLMATVCRTAQPLPTEQQMCPLAAFLKGNQF